MMDQYPSFRTWTPEVYETLHNTLSTLAEGSIEAPLTQLSELLEICFPIFNNVLQNPLPAETDRTKLLARTLSPPTLFEYCVFLLLMCARLCLCSYIKTR